jgi:hypothetical protein
MNEEKKHDPISERNRRNGSKSTGPKTRKGRRATTLSRLGHGIRSESPVIPSLEKAKDWEAHRQAILKSLNPDIGIEQALVERIALNFWRLGRLARFERRRIAEEAGDEDPMESLERRSVENVRGLKADFDLVNRFVESPDPTPIELEEAQSLISWALDEDELESVESSEQLASSPPESRCTIGDVRRYLETIAHGKGTTVNVLIEQALSDIEMHIRREEEYLRECHKQADESLILPESDLKRHLNGMIHRDLHELLRLQAARAGQSVPVPLAVDIGLSSENAENLG